MAQIATHDGVVVGVAPQQVKVEMHVVSACASCKAHASCTFVDKAEKIVDVDTPEWKDYTVGDSVIVSVQEGLGLMAVLLAYIVPALLLIAVLAVTSIMSQSELLAATLPILIVFPFFQKTLEKGMMAGAVKE
jgi:sigma-E factor negative regulatory protein RseC